MERGRRYTALQRIGVIMVVLYAISPLVNAQASTFAAAYGGADYEYAWDVQQTSDGGYVVAGDTSTFGAGSRDIWLLKLDSNGGVAWQKTYGGEGTDGASAMQQTSDGGYVVVGETYSFGAGGGDFWVLKLDSSGDIDWQRAYGGTGSDEASAVQQTADDGYVVVGETHSFGAGNSDFWVLKLDSDGDVGWQQTYGGADGDGASSVEQTADGGYVVAGETYSFGAGRSDYWVLKLDPGGTVDWQRTYGRGLEDYPYAVRQTGDGGYVVVGKTETSGPGPTNLWLLKLNSDGGVDWQSAYGWDGMGTVGYDVQQTEDDGYVVAGKNYPYTERGNDGWVLKLDADGAVDWQRSYGGNDFDRARSVQQTSDGGYVVAGWTESFGAGDPDFWVLKLDEEGTLSQCNTPQINYAVIDTAVESPASSAEISVPEYSNIQTDATISDTGIGPKYICRVAGIPTVSQWGMIMLLGLLAGYGLWRLSRKMAVQ